MALHLTKLQKFIIGVSLQALILQVIILLKVATLQSGTEVLLKIQPVDPRDMFRGDYMTFTYDISNVYYYENVRSGETLYVPLRKYGQFWSADMAVKSKPSEGVYLTGRAKFDSIYQQRTYENNKVAIIYGIEQYFIPEGTGQNARIGQNSFAKVAVGADGKAVVKQIYLEGKPFPQ
jgi:uncharacterized membrane-anchored protein